MGRSGRSGRTGRGDPPAGRIRADPGGRSGRARRRGRSDLRDRKGRRGQRGRSGQKDRWGRKGQRGRRAPKGRRPGRSGQKDHSGRKDRAGRRPRSQQTAQLLRLRQRAEERSSANSAVSLPLPQTPQTPAPLNPSEHPNKGFAECKPDLQTIETNETSERARSRRREAENGAVMRSRRPDSNRGPAHYQGKIRSGRPPTRAHARGSDLVEPPASGTTKYPFRRPRSSLSRSTPGAPRRTTARLKRRGRRRSSLPHTATNGTEMCLKTLV